MKTLVLALGLCATMTSGALPYSDDDHVQFETASVKLSKECLYDTSISRGGVALKGVPLKPILVHAFSIGADRISGPPWLETVCFDVIARLPQGAKTDQVPIMLQALLADRFQLRAHKESRMGTEYSLAIDKGGPKLKESTESSNFMRGRPPATVAVRRDGAGIKGAMTMDMLARTLSRAGYGPVVDATGLDGKYEIDLMWVSPSVPAFGPRGPSASAAEPGLPDVGQASTPTEDLFSALRHSIGLRLEPRKTPIDFLVVDHVERVPTEN
jgi:uncharacterized protein (TIGR03435 family)